MNPKVTVLTPCYNVEKYIGRFLESIIQQDYRPIELILVNDGSTDGTKEIIKKYTPRIVESGIALTHLEKENGGAASAIAEGLPHVSGEYLTWPDSDDVLLPHSIAKRVEYLEAHKNCGIVRSNGYQFYENEPDQPGPIITKIKRTTIFHDFLRFQVAWCPGCYMIRTRVLDEMNPRRYIYTNCSTGQEIQMMLPLVYKYSCEYLDEYLYGYLIRKNSDSHLERTYEEDIKRMNERSDCMKNTLDVIQADTGNAYRIYERTAIIWKLELAWKSNRKKDFAAFKREKRKLGGDPSEVIIMSLLPPNKIAFFLLCVVRGIRRRIFDLQGVLFVSLIKHK